MNKSDIRTLKDKHRLELVMQEAGERFEADPQNADILKSVVTPGLIVNVRMQTYELGRPGLRNESGDVISWLRSRYSWTFATALKFLQNRPPDPIHAQITKVRKKRKPIEHPHSEYVTISNTYTDPVTGSQSYAINYNESIMDDLQKRAFDLWRDAYKHFDKGSDELWDKLQSHPRRFKPVIDFEIEKCARCETLFDWEAGAIAYAKEEAEFITIYGESEDGKIEVTGQLTETDELFIDCDFVICESCMRTYLKQYRALRLVYRSAKRRKERRENDRLEFIREQELDALEA